MPEALARTRHDAVLSRRASPGRRPGRLGALAAATLRRLRGLPPHGYAGAAFAAVLTGILINALALQHQRHPAPFFAAHRPALAGAPSPVAMLPPARPPAARAPESAPNPRPVDAIGQMLREESAAEQQKTVLAAQNALIKLGYTLRADGVANAATLAALRDFERAHALPASTEITPRLVKRLAAAAAGR